MIASHMIGRRVRGGLPQNLGQIADMTLAEVGPLAAGILTFNDFQIQGAAQLLLKAGTRDFDQRVGADGCLRADIELQIVRFEKLRGHMQLNEGKAVIGRRERSLLVVRAGLPLSETRQILAINQF